MGEHLIGSSPQELRLLLLGNIGCGKTSSGDTILSQLSPISPSASRSCQLRRGSSEGRSVSLVEAPRWYWSGGEMEDSVKTETERALTLVAPGPHAILLLVPVSQFTEMESRVPGVLEELFGDEALNHTMVLLTCGDYLMGRTEEEYLHKEHPGLSQIIERCGGRYHVINNRQRQNREQVRELLEKVENMVQENGVYYMKTTQERELEKLVNDRRRELVERYGAQKEEKNETAASKYILDTDGQRSIDRGEEYSEILERRREESDTMEGRVDVREVSNGLHSSTPAPERLSDSEPTDAMEGKRTPSYRLNADGAILSSQMSSSKVTTTLHHRINSFEERSPEASPTSTSHAPVFGSSSSDFPTFDSALPFPQSSSPPRSSSPLPSTLSLSPSPLPPSSYPPQSPPSSSAFSSSPELRLVLLGRSGAGKSAAGNFILGQQEFESRPESLTSITQECEKRKAVIEGRRVAVVDTPDWFNSEQTPDEVRAQISSCVALLSPGPHAFLLCVPLDQPAKTELQSLKALEAVFGLEAVQRHTLVLFTYADRLRESGKAGDHGVEAYIAGQRPDLLKLVEKCGDRFHVMETGGGGGGGGRNSKNVAELLEKVEQTVVEAGGRCYSSPAFQEAENRVRQRQVEIARERRGRYGQGAAVRRLSSEGRPFPYMQSVEEADEEVREEEIEKTREEAEMSVGTLTIQSLPSVTISSLSPSLFHSLMEKMESSAKKLPKLLADSSMWVGEGAKKVKSSPVWGTVGSQAQNVQKMVADSPMWGKVGAGAGHVSKLVGDRVPQVVWDGSAWVGSGAKAAAASPMMGKVGSGARLMADHSMRVGAGIGSGAKNLAKSPMWGNVAKSPMWGKVGSGARTGAKLVADRSMLVGAGIGAGAKKVAGSPVWGKVGSGAKAGAKMVSESSVWQKMGNTAKQVPKEVIAVALLGLLLGVLLAGLIGGAVGTAAGSAVGEVARRQLNKRKALKNEATTNVERRVNDSMDSLVKQGEKVLKTE